MPQPSLINLRAPPTDEPEEVGLPITASDLPPRSGEETGPIIEERKMWRLEIGLFD
jgi:hypothetical protein